MTEPSTNILIAGVGFQLLPYYSEGHTLNASEAVAMNQLRADNIRNNFAKRVKAVRGENAAVSPEEQTALQAELTTYAEEYTFETRVKRGVAKPKLDPVAKEAHRLAGIVVETALNRKGLTKKNLKAEEWDNFITSTLGKYPDIFEQARKNVESLNVIATAALDGLDEAAA